MIRTLIPLFILLLSACSFKTPQNNWQYKSSAIFDSYVQNFLSANDSLAKSDLKRAKHHASMGADLKPLAKISLGECALKISVSKNYSCKEYIKFDSLMEDKSLDAYYHFITKKSLSEEEIALLPKQYQAFATAAADKEYSRANELLKTIEPTTSQLLAASLLGEHISKESINATLESATFHGYKRAVLFYLTLLKEKSSSEDEKLQIAKKIKLLQSIK